MTKIKYSGAFLILVMSGIFSAISSYASADDRNLPGIDIISREERGADETLRYAENASYARYIKDTSAYNARLNGNGVDRGGKFAARKRAAEINNRRRSVLIENYPNDIATDSENDEYNGHELLRAEEFKENKTKIVIHHTADAIALTSEAIAKKNVQDIYKYHAVTRARGDIGYNFLIDPFGNIYEGRAGGKWVVAAHTDWNNTATVGIALMGNFDVIEPTPAAWNSLTKLVTALAMEYKIDPYKQEPYFTAVDQDPWLEVHTHDSIIGHQDAKNTACPGDHVYEKIPALKRTVASYIKYFHDRWVKDFGSIDFVKGESVYASDARTTVHVPLSKKPTKADCTLSDTMVDIVSCTPAWNGVDIELRRLGYSASWPKTIIIGADKDTYIADLTVVRDADMDALLIERKNAHDQQFWPPPTPKVQQKMKNKIKPEDVHDLSNRKVDVLLYDLTAGYDNRDMSCESLCIVKLDGQTITWAKIVNVVKDTATDGLNVFIDLKKYTSKNVYIQNNSIITMTNYDRGVSGYPMNLFRGNISIHKDDYNNLDYGLINRYVIVDSVTLDDYLAGIGEASELQSEEKLKVMALLVKNYALFYIEGKNPHPSLPDGATYNAVDDPRIFQKYLGAGRESYGQKWMDALRATKNEIITYDGYLPILPYFHCSAWYTRAGSEYFGWTDTPWLVSKLDPATCASGDFEGHGVGLSGDGAERLAQKWATYKEILKRYFEGISIDNY